MSGFNKAKGQGQKAWGQVQGQAHAGGDMLQGLRMGGGNGLMNKMGMGGYQKVFGDIGAEGQRTVDDFRENPLEAARQRQAWRYIGGGGSLSEDRHRWNMQTNSRYAENERDKERAADQRGQQATLEQRQQMMHGGIGGGGAQYGAEIQRYNQILAEYAAQQQAFKSQGLQQDLQMLQLLAQLFGGG